MNTPHFSETAQRDENYNGPKYITARGKRYLVENVIHCSTISGSDVRCWVPVEFPDGKVGYLNYAIGYLDMSVRDRKRFFTKANRASIWGKSYAEKTTDFYITRKQHEA